MTSRHSSLFAGAAILVAMILLALFAPLLGTVDPLALDPAHRLRAPGASHWFGTDLLGRDLYSRVLYGARVSLAIGLLVALLSSAGGVLIGSVAAASRWTDALVMRAMDALMSIPGILLAIALMTITGASITNVVLAITLVELPGVSRMVRGVVLSLREQPFIDAAVTSGATPVGIMLRHLLPSVLPPLAVQATFIWAAAMITEATLSFIGAGVPPSVSSWGGTISDGRSLWHIKPYLVFIPAIFLSATVFGVNLLGDGLRDLLDPSQRLRN